MISCNTSNSNIGSQHFHLTIYILNLYLFSFTHTYTKMLGSKDTGMLEYLITTHLLDLIYIKKSQNNVVTMKVITQNT